MPVQVACPKCSKPLSVADGLAGRGARCPHCETVFRVGGSTIGPRPAAESVPAPAPAPAAAPRSDLPAAIGPYAVRRKLGQGAFGIVYQGHDGDLGRDVAIKVLRPTALGSDKYVQRFLREAKVVAQMLHGNIVPVYQLGQYDGGYYIASAFIPGKPLSDVITEQGMDPPRAVRLTIQLLEALAYAHDSGVLHRDVKPDNAMLVERDGKDTLYLMDFGLAGLIDQDEGRMTHDNTVMGTPSYMPPEQARGAIQEVGPASDQYSAGVVLYEMLTGRLPFEGGSMHALIYTVINTPPPALSQWRAGLDARLEKICLKALSKAPTARFPNCRAFAEVLRGWLEGRKAESPSVEKPPAPAEPRKGQPAAPSASVAAEPGGNLSVVRTASSVKTRSTVQAPAGRRTVSEPPAAPAPPTRPPAGGRKSWRIWLLIGACGAALALSVLVAAGYVAWRAAGQSAAKKPPEVKNPGIRDLINQ